MPGEQRLQASHPGQPRRPRPEATANAREAIEGYLETLKELGRPIPEEHEPPTTVVIDVAA